VHLGWWSEKDLIPAANVAATEVVGDDQIRCVACPPHHAARLSDKLMIVLINSTTPKRLFIPPSNRTLVQRWFFTLFSISCGG
jgi:hypothetical protein